MKIKYNGRLNRFNQFMSGKDSYKNPFINSYGRWYSESGENGMKQMTVCEYFWRTVWNVLKLIGLSFMILIILFLAVAMPLMALYTIFFGTVSEDSDWVAMGLAVAFIWFLLFMGTLIYWVTDYFKAGYLILRKKINLPTKLVKDEPKKDSLIKEFYLAKKNKFCKMMEVDYD